MVEELHREGREKVIYSVSLWPEDEPVKAAAEMGITATK